MQINITGHHVEVTDAIRDVVGTKLEKLHQHFPDVASLSVILTVEKHEQIAEVSTHFLGQDFSATGKSEDLYQSIADMTNKLTSLMQRQKEKVKSHSHQRPQPTEDEIVDDK
jgi:putative sigma-54 modulation protein